MHQEKEKQGLPEEETFEAAVHEFKRQHTLSEIKEEEPLKKFPSGENKKSLNK